MNDAFEPIEIPASGRGGLSSGLRYRVEDTKYGKRLRVYLPAVLYKAVKPQPKGWRLDANQARGRGRVSALIQLDKGAKKHEMRADEKSIAISYVYGGGLPAVFPDPEGNAVVELQGATVTSMGIEFDLPVAAKKGESAPAEGADGRPKVRTWPKKA